MFLSFTDVFLFLPLSLPLSLKSIKHLFFKKYRRGNHSWEVKLPLQGDIIQILSLDQMVVPTPSPQKNGCSCFTGTHCMLNSGGNGQNYLLFGTFCLAGSSTGPACRGSQHPCPNRCLMLAMRPTVRTTARQGEAKGPVQRHRITRSAVAKYFSPNREQNNIHRSSGENLICSYIG